MLQLFVLLIATISCDGIRHKDENYIFLGDGYSHPENDIDPIHCRTYSTEFYARPIQIQSLRVRELCYGAWRLNNEMFTMDELIPTAVISALAIGEPTEAANRVWEEVEQRAKLEIEAENMPNRDLKILINIITKPYSQFYAAEWEMIEKMMEEIKVNDTIASILGISDQMIIKDFNLDQDHYFDLLKTLRFSLVCKSEADFLKFKVCSRSDEHTIKGQIVKVAPKGIIIPKQNAFIFFDTPKLGILSDGMVTSVKDCEKYGTLLVCTTIQNGCSVDDFESCQQIFTDLEDGTFTKDLDGTTFVATRYRSISIWNGSHSISQELAGREQFLIELPKRWSAHLGSRKIMGRKPTFHIVPVPIDSRVANIVDMNSGNIRLSGKLWSLLLALSLFIRL